MSDIIVQDITPRVQYTAGIGSTNVFTYPFPIFALTDIAVYYTPSGSTPNDLTQLLVYNVGYTVVNNVAPAVGGQVTLTNMPNAGDVITLARAQPDNRLNNYIDGGLFLSTDVNTDFDRTVFMAQQNTMYDTVLGVHYNVTSNPLPVVDTVLPVLLPGEYWMKNLTNTAIVGVSTVGPVGPILPYLTPVPVAVSQVMTSGNYYTVSSMNKVNLQLPPISNSGDVIKIINMNDAATFSITQLAGQQIRMGIIQTTDGTGGSITNTNIGDSIEITCFSANVSWLVSNSFGNFTVV